MYRRSFLLLVSLTFATLVGPFISPTSVRAQTAASAEADRIEKALTPRRTRGIGVPTVDTKAHDVVDRLMVVRRTRGLSHREQDELHVATEAMPQTDLEIYFSFASAEIDPKSLTTLNGLGELLNRDAFKNNKVVIGGHTDRKGTPDYNQSLSDRRAQAVASFLTANHKVDPARILASGYGFRKLKLPNQPFADANRRVQVVNAAK
jgi:outer membrane protein OmpA-like peptidoglycan-associated protein